MPNQNPKLKVVKTENPFSWEIKSKDLGWGAIIVSVQKTSLDQIFRASCDVYFVAVPFSFWEASHTLANQSASRRDGGSDEDPEVAKFREQGLKFLPEMEFLFKGTIATGFAAYAPSEDSRQYEGFNTRTEETNDNIDDNTDMEVNEPEIDTTTQNTSSAKENGQRKRGREGDKRIGVAAKLSSQLDRIIQTFESSVSAQDPTSITACVAKLKDLPGLERGSELFYKATKLMKKRANRITFVALEEPELQLGWIKSKTKAQIP
ncbi:L10-interacting MYB domain-containing protein [Glycine soja]